MPPNEPEPEERQGARPALPPELAALHREGREIFAEALRSSDIAAAFARRIRCRDRMLVIENNENDGGEDDEGPAEIPLPETVCCVALGKAAVPMTLALRRCLPQAVRLRGVCAAPALPAAPIQGGQRPRRGADESGQPTETAGPAPGIEYFAGGHPLPNRESFRAAEAALRLLRSAEPDSLVIFLISGGGSALFELPAEEGLSVEDTAGFYAALVGSGAPIAAINMLRKHYSAVKGGRLAAAAGGRRTLSIFVSDVPEGQLDALSSGPTLPDLSTPGERREILARYGMEERFPPRVRAFFRASAPATAASHGDSGPARGRCVTLLSNRDLLEAARRQAQARGYRTVEDNRCDDWDYREALRYLLSRFHALRAGGGRLCLLSGGEVTVRLNDTPGTGGRNQQFALACALELAGGPERIACLSAGSDGVDGSSPAAGALADATTVIRARALGLNPEAALQAFDSYPLFAALGDTVLTRPTGNNLRDLRIFLSAPA